MHRFYRFNGTVNRYSADMFWFSGHRFTIQSYEITEFTSCWFTSSWYTGFWAFYFWEFLR